MTLLTTQGKPLIAELERALKNIDAAPDSRISLEIRDGSIIISPVAVGANAENIQEILESLDARFAPAFQSLAK